MTLCLQQELPETRDAAGSAAIDGALANIALEFVVIVQLQSEGVDEKLVDILLRAVVQPGAGVKFLEWLADGGSKALGHSISGLGSGSRRRLASFLVRLPVEPFDTPASSNVRLDTWSSV